MLKVKSVVLDLTAGRYGVFFANGNVYDAQADGATTFLWR